MKTMGICMEGLEEMFEAHLHGLAQYRDSIAYLEIGVAHCSTLKAVCEILAEIGKPWKAWGIDPKPLSSPPPGAQIFNMTCEDIFRVWSKPVDVCFIDGCHSEKCVREDFERVEPFITRGGSVLFHDFGVNSLGGDLQPHCNAPVGVREACRKLGLLTGERPGWSSVFEEWAGDATRGGANMGVFRKL